MSSYDLYRDYIHANCDPDDQPVPLHCYDCDIDLPWEPTGTTPVMDKILSFENIYDDDGNWVGHVPKDVTWIDEPSWNCPKCGKQIDNGYC